MQNNTTYDNRHGLESEKGIHAKAVLEGSLSDQLEIKTGAEIINRDYSWAADSAGRYLNQAFNEVVAAGFAAGVGFFGGGRKDSNPLPAPELSFFREAAKRSDSASSFAASFFSSLMFTLGSGTFTVIFCFLAVGSDDGGGGAF